MPLSESHCHVCGAAGLSPLPGYEGLRRVTSDCRPWPGGGRLAVCAACGTVQNVLDDAWHADCQQIYAGYTIYHQGGGSEQAVFEPASGRGASRSVRLLEQVVANVRLPDPGRLLDIGCGNGALLRAFGRFRSGWSLYGTEFNDKYREAVTAIPGVAGFHTGDPGQAPGRFDLVSLVHVLEHVPQPKAFLARLADKLEAGGVLLIEVPDASQNPFDLLIADHCSHFTPDTLRDLLRAAGYEIVALANQWVPKEITALARKASGERPDRPQHRPGAYAEAARRLAWLGGVQAAARAAAARPGDFGLFGTSIAGTWLFGELNGSVRFFVDEDPHRAGKSYFDRPVYAPRQVPAGAQVFLALPPELAGKIRGRLTGEGGGYHCHLPPPL